LVPAPQTTPRGRLVREVGQVGEIASETAALLVTHDVDHGEFPAPVLACLGRFLPPPQTGDANPDTWWQIPPAELAVRRDYRSALICTIDPLTAKDLDDALHCTPLPDGTFEVGVHIADVYVAAAGRSTDRRRGPRSSYFVQPSSELDVEAARRCTTVYLVQKVCCLPFLRSPP
jgi:exoribonuclease R